MESQNVGAESSLKRKGSISDEENHLENKRKLRREGEKLRRERLNRTLGLLAEEVPWLKRCERRPDKSSILKLTVNYLKLNIGIKKRNLNFVLPTFLKDTVTEDFLGLVACGSLLIISESGTILYMSESLTRELGWLQIDVLGSSINKMIHKDDVELLKLQFKWLNNFHYTTKTSTEDCKSYIPVNMSRKVNRSFFLRMLNLQQGSGTAPHYDEMKIVGHLHYHTQDKKKVRSVLNESWLVGVCRPIAQQNIINMQTFEDNNNPEWISQHAMDGKLWYQDHRVSLVTGLMPNEYIGRSVYDLVRKEDLRDIACSHMKIMTDDEIPCTVFRMDTLDWNSSVKYIKARSVIVKDAWTKKNLFIVSLNQHISDEEGKALLIEQQRRVQALIAATKGLTLQEENFEQSSEVQSIASGSSQPGSPDGGELPSICSSGSQQSVDSWSDSNSAPSGKSPSKDKDTKKRGSLPLLKSLLIGPNFEKGTVNKSETLECRSRNTVLPQHKQSRDQDSNVGKSSFSGEFFGELTGDSGIVTGFERQDVPYISIVDVDLLDKNDALQQSGGIFSPESFPGGNNSAVDKEYFMNQISHFFPNVSSGSVLKCDSKHCEVDCSDKDLPSVSDCSNSISTNVKSGNDRGGILQGILNSGTPLLMEKTPIKDIQKVQSPTISSQISPQTDNACVQDSSEVKVELRFHQQLQQKHDVLERSLHLQNQELTILKRNLRDNQHYPHLVEKLNNLQSEIQEQCKLLKIIESEMRNVSTP